MFDCGAIVQQWRPERIFITHTHSDHVNRVTHVVSRRKPPTIYVPQSAKGLVEGYINAHQAMTDNRPLSELLEAMQRGHPDWTVNRNLVPVSVGDKLQINKGNSIYRVEVIKCEHYVDCIGYCIYEVRKGLKEQYKGLPGKEIAALRKSGVEINEEIEKPLFVFMGDTTTAVFQNYPEIFKFPAIITECSFFKDEHKPSADKSKHTFWGDLEPFIKSNPNTCFILIHFSLRYSSHEIIEFFASQSLPNVVPFIDPNDTTKWLDE